MNIFFLARDPVEAAQSLVDKHIVKMPVESAQMMSTAHRMLDGEFVNYEYWDSNFQTRLKKMWLLDGEEIKISITIDKDIERVRPIYTHPRGVALYSPTHASHPSSAWTMSGKDQYLWHYEFTRAMLDEYTLRYGKRHGVEKIMDLLRSPPKNIPNIEWTDPSLAMPDQYKGEDHVESYRKFYVAEKSKFASWKNREAPQWFKG